MGGGGQSNRRGGGGAGRQMVHWLRVKAWSRPCFLSSDRCRLRCGFGSPVHRCHLHLAQRHAQQTHLPPLHHGHRYLQHPDCLPGCHGHDYQREPGGRISSLACGCNQPKPDLCNTLCPLISSRMLQMLWTFLLWLFQCEIIPFRRIVPLVFCAYKVQSRRIVASLVTLLLRLLIF